MTLGPLFSKLNARITLDRDEGNIAYFHALSLELEYITKLVIAGIVACIEDDPDRHKYSLEYNLVRADSIGEWVSVLNNALTGPSAQYFLPIATQITRDLTERVTEGDWRYTVVRELTKVAAIFEIDSPIGQKVAFRQFFDLGATIRNRTRGHGATTSDQCGYVCPMLAKAIDIVITNHKLFKYDWAYLHRNLSGKYKVSRLLGDCSGFDYLKGTRDEILPNGIFIDLGMPQPVRLVFSDPDLQDLLVPNGNFKGNTFEALSFITNNVARKDGSNWLIPPGRLPESHTHGLPSLEQIGNTFTNLPPAPSGHITRNRLQSQLQVELLKYDRHPYVLT